MGDYMSLPYKRVFNGWAAQAQRKAVLGQIPTCQPSLYSGSLETRILSAMEQLRKAWAARLSELKTAGWNKIQDPSDFSYTLRCAPFGLRLTTDEQQSRSG